MFFCVLVGSGEGVPHLKTGMSARVGVSPPISTKKININFGWGSYVVGRGWTDWGKVTGIAELKLVN